jgi:hypothetical protein
MNLIQVKQVQGLASNLAAGTAYTTAVSGHLEQEIYTLMTGDSTFSGIKTFEDQVVFLSPVTGQSSGNFKGGLWVDADKVLTTADTGNLFVTLVDDQDITGIKTFQGADVNTIFQGGTVYVKQWGDVGEADVALRVTGQLWITGSDGGPMQIVRNGEWEKNPWDNIYYNPGPTGKVGINTTLPDYSLHVSGTGYMDKALSLSTHIGGGDSDQKFCVEGVVPFDSGNTTYIPSGGGVHTGAVFSNSVAIAQSSTVIRLAVDPSEGAGGFGAVDLVATREDGNGLSSLDIYTKTGLVPYEGFDSRFKISGAAILVDHDTLPSSNPEVRGQLWLKPKSSTPGSSYLLVSSGAAP